MILSTYENLEDKVPEPNKPPPLNEFQAYQYEEFLIYEYNENNKKK